jgi:hypothetical protein
VGVKISFGWSKENTPKKRNSHVRTVVKADTPIATVTKGSGSIPPRGLLNHLGARLRRRPTMTGKKRCLSSEGGLAIRLYRFLNKTAPSRGLIAKAAVASAYGRSHAQGYNGASRQGQARIERSRAQGCNGASRQGQALCGRS